MDDDLWSKEYLLAAEKSYRAQDNASRYLQQLRQIVEDLSVYPTGQSLKEVFWRSLIQDDAQKEPARLGACLDTMTEHLGSSEDVAVENYADIQNARRRKDHARWAADQRRKYRTSSFTLAVGLVAVIAAGLQPIPFFQGSLLAGWELYFGVGFYSLLTCTVAFRLQAAAVRWEAHKLAERLRKLEDHVKNGVELTSKMSVNMGRLLCVTEKGYVAWAPRWVQEGDLIYRIVGSEVPCVLRSRNETGTGGAEAFELVGDVYVHGIMSNGAIETIDEPSTRIWLI